jgi:hypothetical protein
VAKLRFIDDAAGQKGAQGKGDVEQLGRDGGDAQGRGQHRQGEQLAGAGAADPEHQPGYEANAGHEH